jgi:hypothetical protein
MWALITVGLCLFMLYRALVYSRAERFLAALGALVAAVLLALASYVGYQTWKAEKVAAAPKTVKGSAEKPKPAEKKPTEKLEKVAPETDIESGGSESFGDPAVDAEPTSDFDQQ